MIEDIAAKLRGQYILTVEILRECTEKTLADAGLPAHLALVMMRKANDMVPHTVSAATPPASQITITYGSGDHDDVPVMLIPMK